LDRCCCRHCLHLLKLPGLRCRNQSLLHALSCRLAAAAAACEADNVVLAADSSSCCCSWLSNHCSVASCSCSNGSLLSRWLVKQQGTCGAQNHKATETRGQRTCVVHTTLPWLHWPSGTYTLLAPAAAAWAQECL
jgi:hypothetical protein